MDRPDPQPLGLGVPLGQHAAAFERSGRRPLDGEVQFEQVRRGRDRRDRVPVALDQFGRHVAGHVGMHEMLAVASRVDPDDGRQRLVIHHDRLGRVLGQVPVGGDHHHDRLAHVIHLVGGQREACPGVGERRVRDQQRQRLGEPGRQVLVAVDRDQPGHLERAADIDVGDARVGEGAAHERGGERVMPKII